MKFLRIIILVALVVSFMPLDAFCDDHGEESEHHHGVVLCHASCCSAVLQADNDVMIQDTTSYLTALNGFTYEEPILPTEFRPPITVS